MELLLFPFFFFFFFFFFSFAILNLSGAYLSESIKENQMKLDAVFDSFTSIALPLLRIFGEHTPVSPILLSLSLASASKAESSQALEW